MRLHVFARCRKFQKVEVVHALNQSPDPLGRGQELAHHRPVESVPVFVVGIGVYQEEQVLRLGHFELPFPDSFQPPPERNVVRDIAVIVCGHERHGLFDTWIRERQWIESLYERKRLDEVCTENKQLREADSLIRQLISARDANSSVLGEAVISEMRYYLARQEESGAAIKISDELQPPDSDDPPEEECCDASEDSCWDDDDWVYDSDMGCRG